MAAPAEPLLASSIWNAHRLEQSVIEQASEGSEPTKQRRLKTGCKSIDDTFKSGLSYGEGGICCISAAKGAGGSELCHTLLTSHLLSSPLATATIIDTTGIGVRTLYQAIKTRLHTTHAPSDLDSAATALFDRISITRVFDLEGALEGLAEFRSTLETKTSGFPSTIPDSQIPELGDLLFDDELTEMTPQQQPLSQDREGLAMLLIESLDPLFLPLQRDSYVQCHSLLTTFLRSLGHTTRLHGVCTVLLNSATVPMTSATPQTGPGAGDAVSIFPSCGLRPSLSRTVEQGVDVHLLVHCVPKTARDAGVVYGDKGTRGGRRGEWVSVVEVLVDRLEGRGGRFGVFTFENGVVQDVMF